MASRKDIDGSGSEMEEEWDQPGPWPETDEDDYPEEWPPEELPDLWVAHDQPERPLAYGAWLCDCERCALSLQMAAIHEPRLPIVLKTGSDRVVVTAEYAHQVWSAMGGLEPLCYVRRDYIREVFVGQWLWWMRSDRWWTLARSERTKCPTPQQSDDPMTRGAEGPRARAG